MRVQPLETLQELKKKAIIETITNENGTAIKYSNGIMICLLNIEVTDQAIDTQYGGTIIYIGRRGWTFPAPFITKPLAVTCGSFRWGTSGSWGSVSSFSATDAALIGYDLYSRATGTKCNISAMAIGRWKN